MKKTLFSLLTILSFIACKKDSITGREPVRSEFRTVSQFSGVTSNGATNVFIQQSQDIAVEVSAYANLLPYLETKVSNNTLLIGYERGSNVRNDNSEVLITMPQLKALTTSGSGNISVSGTFSSASLDAFSRGSGNITLPKGTVHNLNIQTAGSGNIEAKQFLAVNADITIEGSGDVTVYVSGKLNVKIKGSGNVYYKGIPDEINTTISGSGKVIKLEG